MPHNHSLPPLTESDIARYCTEQSFGRGEDYYYRGAISRPIRQGLTLRAEQKVLSKAGL
jgi:uncharacterized Zn finger protein